VRAAVEITPPPDIHLVNGEAVGAETAVGIALPLLERCNEWYGCSWCGDSDRNCAASAGVL
jgi:hypothetical protein